MESGAKLDKEAEQGDQVPVAHEWRDDFSSGFHLGCGVHALAIIVILLMTVFSEKFFVLLAGLGLVQLLYVLPAAIVIRKLGCGPRSQRGFFAPAALVLILNLIGLGIYHWFRPQMGW